VSQKPNTGHGRAGIRARGPESEQGSRRWKAEKELGCSAAMAGRARGAAGASRAETALARLKKDTASGQLEGRRVNRGERTMGLRLGGWICTHGSRADKGKGTAAARENIPPPAED
jgi:hypothetical protein